MKRLIDALTDISKILTTGTADWLSSAEASIEFIKENVQSEQGDRAEFELARLSRALIPSAP